MPSRPSSALAAMLAGMDDDDEPAASILPEAAIAELRIYAERYWEVLDNGPLFKRGDIVTPMRGTTMKGAGEPHIVLEVLWPAGPGFSGDTSGNAYGRRSSLRIASISRGCRVCHWVEAHEMEPYTSPAA